MHPPILLETYFLKLSNLFQVPNDGFYYMGGFTVHMIMIYINIVLHASSYSLLETLKRP
jgi:hypothetical protein